MYYEREFKKRLKNFWLRKKFFFIFPKNGKNPAILLLPRASEFLPNNRENDNRYRKKKNNFKYQSNIIDRKKKKRKEQKLISAKKKKKKKLYYDSPRSFIYLLFKPFHSASQ